MPSLFLSHGSPMIAIQDTPYTQFLKDLGQKLSPKAIILFSAHWERETLTISCTDGPYETIHDFYGFPKELFEVQYPAPGSVKLSKEIQNLFEKHGIPAHLDPERGLDHGSWTVLKHMYPKANVPVVQISIHPFLPPSEQYAIGSVLSELAKDDCLVAGSGATVHNLRLLKWEEESGTEPWAIAFDDWLIQQILEENFASLFSYEELAPYAKLAVPRPEHIVPLFLALGSSKNRFSPQVLYRSYEMGSLSYLCLQFA